MNRLQIHMRKALFAVLVGIAGMLAFQATPASATPTLPPIIDATPPDPNTTGPASFTVSPNPAETANVTELRCKVASAKPSGFNICWTADPDDQYDGTWIPQNMVNGPATFQTQAYDGSLGPIATYNWTQNTPAPSQPPVFTETPDDINTVMPAHFAFEPGAGDEGKVNGFQCRVDSDDPAGFVDCNVYPTPGLGASRNDFGELDLVASLAGPGTHTLDVRAKTDATTTPFVSETWTNDVPAEINPSVSISDVAITQWAGNDGDFFGNGSQNLNPTQNAGDVNGDGLDDLLAGSLGASMDEALVLFSTANGLGQQSIGSSLGPNRGYAMRSAQNVSGYDAIGDQNGDGVPDFLVSAASTAVVYGVADPVGLPKCEVGFAQKRCIDLDNLTDAQGYYLNTGFGGNVAGAGDFDGDGKDDLQISYSFPTAESIIFKGGIARTGTVDPTTLPANETFTILPPSGGFYGGSPSALGDLNGDGKGEYSNGEPFSGNTWIVYGRAFGSPTLDIAAGFGEDEGMLMATSALTFTKPWPVGDVNGDGRPDLTATGLVQVGLGSILPVMYTPEQPTEDPYLPEGQANPGYTYYGPEAADEGFGKVAENAGDFNNDGVPDLASGATTADNGAINNAGAALLLFGQRPGPEDPLVSATLGLTSETGVAILGDAGHNDFDGVGSGIASLGDVTGDGIRDYAIADPGDGSQVPKDDDQGGDVYIVSGGKILANAKFGPATAINKESATLNASVTTTGRDTEVTFEYGTSDDYGSETPVQEVEGSNSATPVEAALTGLSANTEYHYRAVTTNSLGLTYYGDDQTFSTDDVSPPVVDPCDTNPAGPGCADYCVDNPTAMGCPGYDWCAANPGKCGKTPNAKLAMISITKKIAVKRGKRGTIQVAVVNTGGKAAKGVKVCVKAPKKFVKVKACTKVGSLGSGASRTVKIKVKAKRKRGKAVLKLTAKGSNVSAKKAKATVVIR